MQVIEPLRRNSQNIAENFLSKWPMTTWSFVTADCAFHVCMGVLFLLLDSKSIGIHEIPVPQNQIHSMKQTSPGVRVTKQLH